MEEQYITEVCYNKLNDIIEDLRYINPAFIVSTAMKQLEGEYYYSLFVRRADFSAPVQITFAEYWLYNEPLYKLLGRVIYEICFVTH